MKIFGMLLWLGCATAWSVRDGGLYFGEEEVSLRGINWYGAETHNRVVEGLWSHPISFYLDVLAREGFNAMRIPVTEDMILRDGTVVEEHLVSAEPRAPGKTPMGVIDIVMSDALERGIAVLLDVHRLSYGASSPLWYVPGSVVYTQENLVSAIDALFVRYKDFPNLLGVDVFNEPHHDATYGSGDPATDWRVFLRDCAAAILADHPDRLLFANGLDWGKNFSAYAALPPELPEGVLSRIIVSPHMYGPPIVYVSRFTREWLYAEWDALFGYLADDRRFHLCVGEWGTRYTTIEEKTWMDLFAGYLVERNIRNNFYWALNPYSKDVGGLLGDWEGAVCDPEKTALLRLVVPAPTVFAHVFTRPWIRHDVSSPPR
jgi:endoglucanase